MAKTKKYAATNENLMAHALAPTMRWLIAVALDGATMTYGDVKEKLENEAGFSTVFATRIGLVAGELMHLIQSVEPNAPLINVLVVNQKDRQPSEGAGGFMARRFGISRLDAKNAKSKYPKLWKSNFERAAAEVYKFDENQWAKLYKKVFKETLQKTKIEKTREDRQEGNENDGDTAGGKYGPGGEGPHHKNCGCG